MNRKLGVVIFKGNEHIVGAHSADYVVEFRIARPPMSPRRSCDADVLRQLFKVPNLYQPMRSAVIAEIGAAGQRPL